MKTLRFLGFAFLLTLAVPAFAMQVAISEIMYRPSGTKPEFIEIWNVSATPLDTAKWRFTDGITFEFPDFSAAAPQNHFLKGQERILVSSATPAATRAAYPNIPANVRIFGPWTGALDNSGERITLVDKNGVIMSSVSYKDGGRWPKAADGTGHSLVLRNENREIDDWHNWAASTTNGGSPGSSDSGAMPSVIELGDTWKYFLPDSDPGTAWRGLNFDDSSWASGPALIGFASSTPSPGIQTNLASPDGTTPQRVTYLFRKTFVFDGNPAGATFAIDQVVDDGVIYYLNGQRLGSTRLATTAAWDATATFHGTPVLESNAHSGTATGLVNGVNVLTAEVHQSAANSSDMVFGARLKLRGGGGVPRLSEAHFASNGRVDWVELQNPAGVVQSVGGLAVASTRDFSDKVALSGTVPANSFISFNVNFPTDADGKVTLYLIDASNNVVGCAELRRVAGRESMQAEYPAPTVNTAAVLKTQPEWYACATHTRDAANNLERSTAIVINEIMADPPGNQREGEFIELHNRSNAAVNIGGWRFTSGVDFVFPPGTSIPAGGHLVVAANAAALNAASPGANAIGNWDGQLSNSGELIQLRDAIGNLVDEVDYKFGGSWPELAHGDGSSLELTHPDADNSMGSAWQDSNESAKSAFQSFTITGVYGRSAPATIDDELRLWTTGDTHMILRNVVLRPTAGGSNILVNADKVTNTNENTTGWLARGTHWATFADAEGIHLVTSGKGDNKANHMEKNTTGMQANTSYTLTFEARWVSGSPRLIAQTWDTTWGGTVLLPIPSNLGTPGAANSRTQAAPAPQIGAAIHSPAVPKPNLPVTITARVSSVSPLTEVMAVHRADNINGNGTWASTAMNDNGTAGDSEAGDGIWTAQVANYPTDKTVVQFYVRATATNGQSTEYPRGGAADPGLWVVDNRAVPTDLRRIRFVASAYWLDALNDDSATGGHTAKFNFKFPLHSNHAMPCTLIHDESEIYYGARVRRSGSPWTRGGDANPDSVPRGELQVPGDLVFRGQEQIYWDSDGGDRLHHNRIMRYWLYLLGVPGNENEYVRVTRNSDAPTVRESSEAYTKEMLNRLFENGSQGEFYEIDDTHYMGDDGASRLASVDGSWTYKNTDNPTAYMNSWVIKSRETEFDFTPLTEWMRQLTQNGNSLTQEQLDRMADSRAMAVYAAVRGYGGDWDNISIRRGKNSFFYRRATDGKWMLMHWDSDLAFQNTSEAVLASAGGTFDRVAFYYNRPVVRRYLNYYLTEMLNKYTLNSTRMNAWLTAEENASTSYSIGFSYAGWFSGRKAAIDSFLGTAATTGFTLTNPPSSTSDATVDLAGTAPSAAFHVAVDDHPEAVFSWTSTTAWSLTGIRLKSGANPLTLRMKDEAGGVVGNPLSHTVTKSGDAPPVLVVTSNPASRNVALGEPLTLDASASSDPEGTALNYTWSVSPSTGVTVSTPSAAVRTAIFSQPGIYTFTVQATDGAGQSSTTNIEISAFNTTDFSSFGDPFLPADFTAQNVEPRDNYSPGAWYALDDVSGRLIIQVLNDSAKPLANPVFTHPFVSRSLPGSGDWVLQTDLTLEGPQFGAFGAGLLVEMVESGQTVRYTFSVVGGNDLVVQRAAGNGAYTQLATRSSLGVNAELRVRRSGTQLIFQRLINDAWTTVHTATIPAGATGVRGGPMVYTTSAFNVAVSFDYLLLANPGNTTSLVEHLRITEIMYNPVGVGGPEFIELTNTGTTPLNLQGAYFEDGKPFDHFVFGAITLQPGAYIVVTNDTTAFQARYGSSVQIAGQYTGALSNSGERIVLRDAAGNPIMDFTYGDNPALGWPTQPDGGGYSLEVLFTNGDYNNPLNWGGGTDLNGSPGAAGSGPDTDRDGQGDRAEALAGTNSRNPASSFKITDTVRNASGQMTLTWPSAPGRSYRVEFRQDVANGAWQTLATVPSGGTQTSFTDPSSGGVDARFYRVVVVP